MGAERKQGRLYGVSVGPGDPELMTVKALRCLERVPVLAVPRTKGDRSIALGIVQGILDTSDKTILYLDFLMVKDPAALAASHRHQARQIMDVLDNGEDVAMLSLGDASLYSSYSYLRELVEQGGYETVTIAGVPSFCAVAAALGKRLTAMDQPLTILPGSFGAVAEELDRPGSKVIMKSGRALGEIKALLEEKGLAGRASLVADCGLPGERLFPDIRDSADEESYFTTILVGE